MPCYYCINFQRSPPLSGRSSDQDDDSESRKSYSPDYEQHSYASVPESKYSQGNTIQGNERYDNRNFKTVRRPSEASYDVSAEVN